MRTSRAVFVALAFAALCASASTARAIPLICEIGGSGPEPDVFCNMPIPCDDASACSIFEDPACDAPLGTRVCRPACGTLIACVTNTECPGAGTVVGTCGPSSHPLGAFCRYPAIYIDYCIAQEDVLTAERLSDCHRVPGATAAWTSSYYHGDCDGDGCPNGADASPCAPGGDCLLPGFVGPLCPRPLVVAGIDAGVAPIDAGARVDAGASMDGGTPARDAGVVAIDGGVRDSGAFDAGPLVLEFEPEFSGGGGCACRAAPGSRAPWPAWASITIALLWIARRSRARG